MGAMIDGPGKDATREVLTANADWRVGAPLSGVAAERGCARQPAVGQPSAERGGLGQQRAVGRRVDVATRDDQDRIALVGVR